MAISSSAANNVIYVDCNSNDELFGEKLASIVDYARSVMGIDSVNCNRLTKEQSYAKYCEGLSTKIDVYEPYCRSVEMRDFKTSLHYSKELVDKIRSLLPRKTPEFNQIIDEAANNLCEKIETNNLLIDARQKELTLAEFVVLKIFRSGENLEMVPCFLKVYSKREECSMFFKTFNWSDCKASMDYEERTYVLHKFMIKEIITKLANKKYGF